MCVYLYIYIYIYIYTGPDVLVPASLQLPGVRPLAAALRDIPIPRCMLCYTIVSHRVCVYMYIYIHNTIIYIYVCIYIYIYI